MTWTSKTVNVLCHLDLTNVFTLFALRLLFCVLCVTYKGETGGVMLLTNTGHHAQLVLQVMAEAARTIFATKVRQLNLVAFALC